MEHPPQSRALTGFRDPYIIQRGGGGGPWKIAIGSGIKGSGGTILQYTSDHLLEGASPSSPCLMMQLQKVMRHGKGLHCKRRVSKKAFVKVDPRCRCRLEV